MRDRSLSLTIYRTLLHLYPPAFRRAYGEQMVAAFQLQRGERRYAQQRLGALIFWFEILTDLSASAIRRHLASRLHHPRFPRKRESVMGTFAQDLRYAVRGLLQHRGLTVAALLTLAIGIGANTAMFSLVDGVLLRPFPYPDPERLVFIWDSNPGRGWNKFSVSPPNFIDYRERNTTFDRMTAYYNTTTTLTGMGEAERLQVSMVGPDYFQTFGIQPQIGRAFTPEDNEPGNNNVTILSARLWSRRFGSDPGVIGRSITLSGFPTTIVGVFTAPNDAPESAELWLPEDFSSDNLGSRGAHYFTVIGRRKPEATHERAADDLRRIAVSLASEYPDTNAGWTVVPVPLHEERVGDARRSLLLLSGAVALVLLIACANIANLLLARATGRRREIAVRVALGAGRGRLLSQVLSESVLLALAGGAAGVLVAQLLTTVVTALAPDSLPRLAQVGIDPRVLGYTLVLSIGTGLLFGIVPAWQSASADVNRTLRSGSRGDTSGGGVRYSLVVAEVALAVVVVIGATLLTRTLWQLEAIDPGFAVENRITGRIGLPRTYAEPEDHARFYTQLLSTLSATPGIERVAATTRLPMGGDFSISFTIEGRAEPPDEQEPSGELRIVSPGYFDTLGIPLLRGRSLEATDRLDTPPVAVINQRLADLYFRGEDPIGQRMRIGYRHSSDAERVREIVGIVDNTRVFGLASEPTPVYYLSYRQTPEPAMNIVATTGGDAATAASLLRREVAAIDDDIPLYSVRTLQQHVRGSTGRRRFRAALLGSFAAVALLLASVGIHGVMAYSVAQRTRELGIRMALGAGRGEVLRMVLRRGLMLTAAGVGLGALGAASLGRLVSGFLFGVTPTDPTTYGFVAAFLVVIALIACYLPALRATRVDPTVAMRAE
jgi:putative ABC transport system permease protein